MDAKKVVNRYYELVDKFQNGYFWSGFGNSQQRQKMEKENNFDFIGEIDGGKLEIHFSINPSRNNLYKRQSITLNGKRVQRRTMMRLLNEKEA